MPSSRTSRRDVFRTIAAVSFCEWPAYQSTPLYDQQSLSALEEDIRTVASEWFTHDAHDCVEAFVTHLPLAYMDFRPHDTYSAPTRYEMTPLIRAFVLKTLHGWAHETALVEHLQNHPHLRRGLGFDSIPDQSTLWRSWHERFSAGLRETIETAARTILFAADRAGVDVPRQPERPTLRHEAAAENPSMDRAVLEQAAVVTDHVSDIVYPAFSLPRGEGCAIHEHAFWDLQTHLGLRENLAANEGARGFVYESQRERTPLGHVHRKHIRRLSIAQIRTMYRTAISRLLDRLDETEAFHGAGIVAIDITEADPFRGDRTGHEDEIIGTKEQTDEYAYQWATIQLVGNAVPLVLDARPVRKGETRVEIVEDLLESAQDLVHIDNVLMDREFDSQHVLEAISQRGLSYVVPKRMYTSERATAKRLCDRDIERSVIDRKLHLGNNEWHETTLIYRRNERSDHDDYRQYSVFMSNRGASYLTEYAYRWEIERGYRTIKRFMAATTSKSFVLRFFYFAFACLLYSMWRGVDLLVQVELTGKYERSPLVTADNTLTLLKKATGIG